MRCLKIITTVNKVPVVKIRHIIAECCEPAEVSNYFLTTYTLSFIGGSGGNTKAPPCGAEDCLWINCCDLGGSNSHILECRSGLFYTCIRVSIPQIFDQNFFIAVLRIDFPFLFSNVLTSSYWGCHLILRVNKWIQICLKSCQQPFPKSSGCIHFIIVEIYTMVFYKNLTSSMAYGTRRFDDAFTRALQHFLSWAE